MLKTELLRKNWKQIENAGKNFCSRDNPILHTFHLLRYQITIILTTRFKRISKQTEASRESGMITLQDGSFIDGSSIVNGINSLDINELTWNEVNGMKSLSKQIKDTSSDYFTSNELSGSMKQWIKMFWI